MPDRRADAARGAATWPSGTPSQRAWSTRTRPGRAPTGAGPTGSRDLLDADARAAGGPGLEYANLAVRGRLLGRILEEQLPAALSSGADLVSLSGGGNDLLRPGADVDALALALDDAVAALRATGADVLLTAGFDPRSLPVIRLTRGRVAAFNLHLWAIARRHGALVVDLWGMRALYDPRLWADDRIHLGSEGHRRVALLAAATLRGAAGAAEEEWARPLDPPPPRSRLAASRDDVAWARQHLAPWVSPTPGPPLERRHGDRQAATSSAARRDTRERRPDLLTGRPHSCDTLRRRTWELGPWKAPVCHHRRMDTDELPGSPGPPSARTAPTRRHGAGPCPGAPLRGRLTARCTS